MKAIYKTMIHEREKSAEYHRRLYKKALEDKNYTAARAEALLFLQMERGAVEVEVESAMEDNKGDK
jgi:hypothetical protein